ncbi:MAG: 3-keto-disaccharide hydrolase [Opitutaceae bacterium]
MKPFAITTLVLAGVLALDAAEDGFHPLFNGRDLTGWIDVNGHPGTWQVRDGMIVCTGQPAGFLRTGRQYENFILEFEWLHQPRTDGEPGNAGLFIWADPIPAAGQGNFTRAVEVQILAGLERRDPATHALTVDRELDCAVAGGDAVMVPFAEPSGVKFRGNAPLPPERVRAIGGAVHAPDAENVAVAGDGHEVSGVHGCSVRKGYLALDSEGNPIRFRNLRIKELPSSNPSPGQIAPDGTSWERLYNRLDLSNWKVDAGHAGHWKAEDWKLTYDGKSEASDKNLWTKKTYGDFELICDWRLTGQPKKRSIPIVLPNGEHAKNPDGTEQKIEIDDFGDSGIYLRGSSKSQVNIWSWPIGSGEVYGYRMDKTMPLEVRTGVTPRAHADHKPGEWNRFHITMRGDRLTVMLNGETVVENAQLPGVPPTGPLALQHHGDPIEFANLYIRNLPAGP